MLNKKYTTINRVRAEQEVKNDDVDESGNDDDDDDDDDDNFSLSSLSRSELKDVIDVTEIDINDIESTTLIPDVFEINEGRSNNEEQSVNNQYDSKR